MWKQSSNKTCLAITRKELHNISNQENMIASVVDNLNTYDGVEEKSQNGKKVLSKQEEKIVTTMQEEHELCKVTIRNISEYVPKEFIEKVIEIVETAANTQFIGTSFTTYEAFVQLNSFEKGRILCQILNNTCIGDSTIFAQTNEGFSPPLEKSTPESVKILKRSFEDLKNKYEKRILDNARVSLSQQVSISTFKTMKCRHKQCSKEVPHCIFYHSKLDRRRNPFEFSYGYALCSYKERCNKGDNCQFSHNYYEWLLHPLHHCCYFCDFKISRKQCFSSNPLCMKIHRDSPDLFFNTFWIDSVVFDSSMALKYLVGVIRQFNSYDIKYRVCKIVFLSECEEYLDFVGKVVRDICKLHSVNFGYLGRADFRPHEEYQLVMGTPVQFVNRQSRPLGFLYTAVIVNEIDVILKNPKTLNDLKSSFHEWQKSGFSQARIQKLFVTSSDSEDLASRIRSVFNINLKVITNPDWFIMLDHNESKLKTFDPSENPVAGEEFPQSEFGSESSSRKLSVIESLLSRTREALSDLKESNDRIPGEDFENSLHEDKARLSRSSSSSTSGRSIKRHRKYDEEDDGSPCRSKSSLSGSHSLHSSPCAVKKGKRLRSRSLSRGASRCSRRVSGLEQSQSKPPSSSIETTSTSSSSVSSISSLSDHEGGDETTGRPQRCPTAQMTEDLLSIHELEISTVFSETTEDVTYLVRKLEVDELMQFEREDELLRLKIRSEFEAYKLRPESHPSYKYYWCSFFEKYQNKYSRSSKSRKREIFHEFWKSKLDILESHELRKRIAKLIQRFSEKSATRSNWGELKPYPSVPMSSPFKNLSSEGSASSLVKSDNLKGFEDFSVSDAISLLESALPDFGLFGPSVGVVLRRFKEQGTDSETALKVFTDPENIHLIEMALNKLSTNPSKRGAEFSKLVVAKVRSLLNYSKLVSNTRKELNIEAIANATFGDAPDAIINMIKTASAYEGIQLTNQQIDDYYMVVCSKHIQQFC